MKKFFLCFLLISCVTASSFSQTLKFLAKGWISCPASSSMRVAEFVLLKAIGDTEDGEVVIYFFGGQGGSVEANLDRWMSQMAQSDGRPSREVAKSIVMTVNGLKVTILDVTGRYIAEITPGSNERHNKQNFRLIAAVAETPKGPYFLKATGPAKTIH